jgi:hypothetical protein
MVARPGPLDVQRTPAANVVQKSALECRSPDRCFVVPSEGRPLPRPDKEIDHVHQYC